MNEKNILQELLSTNAQNPTTAVQGVKLKELKNRQLHPSCEQLNHLESTDIQEFFFLITEVNDVTCKVIPGSLDGVMAGPNDIILPKNVLGQYVYLSMDMQTTVPKSALSDGFAILDDECYQRIMASCKEFADGSVGEIHPYSRAMPYISDHDDRIEYHNKQKLLLEDMQKIYSKPRLPNFPHILNINWDKLPNINLSEMKRSGDDKYPSQLFSIIGHNEIIKISDLGKELMVQVFTDNNKPCRNKFNMWYILNDRGFVIGSIIQGCCRISKNDLAHAICLADYDGKLTALAPIE